MSTLVVPELLEEVRKFGRFDVNACLNCGTCTVKCNLAEGGSSFPRKVMQRALLGLKRSLLASPEPWLCHDCGDCSVACPRQAEPQESMMTLRRYLAGQYDLTGLSSRILSSRAWEIGSICFTAVLVFALVMLYHLYYVELPVADFVSTSMGMEHMFDMIVYFTVVVCLIPLVILMGNALRMHRFTFSESEGVSAPLRLYFVELKAMILHMVSQKNMRKCDEAVSKKRWGKHWLLVFGFSVKFIIILFFLKWFQTDSVYPVYHPQRWLGYIIALVLIVVPLDILFGRARKRLQAYKFSEFSDLTLPIMLLLTALSGLAVHVFRYMEFSLTCHFAYALHVAIAVPLVLIELPFGKLSHAIYRPLALYFQAVKERALAQEKTVVETISGETVPA